MKNFAQFCAVDWSGAKEAGKGIALAHCAAGDEAPVLEPAVRSRTAVADWITSRLGAGRMLVGIDCNFGYSAITGAMQFGRDYKIADLWQAVEQANAAAPDYFAGGYWTHAEHGRHFWTQGPRPEGFCMPQRATETACAVSGLGHPESPFKLIGAKQVGKGGLAGMRMLLDLKRRYGDRIAVWPFEPELVDSAEIVLAEIYPRLFLRKTGHGNAKIRTLEALNHVLCALGSRETGAGRPFSDHEADALASASGLRFLCGTGKTVPENISIPPAPQSLVMREGWIFGAG